MKITDADIYTVGEDLSILKNSCFFFVNANVAMAFKSQEECFETHLTSVDIHCPQGPSRPRQQPECLH